MLTLRKSSKIKIYLVILAIAAMVCVFILRQNKIIFYSVGTEMADDENLIKINYFNKKTAGIKKIDTCIFYAGCETNEKFKKLEEYNPEKVNIKSYKIGNSNPFKKSNQ